MTFFKLNFINLAHQGSCKKGLTSKDMNRKEQNLFLSINFIKLGFASSATV